MKIEIGENLIQSYLKHVEGCRLVQTNWKPSTNWTVTEFDNKEAKNLFDKFSQHDSFREILNKSSFTQFIKQAEIDVLGINNAESTLYGVDIAFHTSGVQYGDSKETINRIAKKLLRAVFVMQSYFNEYDKFTSLFVAPKSHKATYEGINQLIPIMNEIIGSEMIEIDFITNDEFFDTIVAPTINSSKIDHDTSELFLRSVKLLALDKRQTTTRVNQSIKISNTSKSTTQKRTVNGMKIGQYVQHTMKELHENNLLPQEEIKRLQSANYSKDIFGQNIPVLRKQSLGTKDNKGYNRYYTNHFYFGKYFLSSQWTEKHFDAFLNWQNKSLK